MIEIPADIIEKARSVVIDDLGMDIDGKLQDAYVESISEAIHAERERCENLARRYSVGYEKAIGIYGSADKDSGRGRQEGHITAGREIADLIRISASLPPAPKGAD